MLSRTLTITIHRSPEDVYAFVSNPENFAKFVAFVRSVRRERGEWILDTDVGQLTLRFAVANELGVLDHTVTLPSGEKVLNPMRVIPNGEGSEVIFSVFQRAGVSAEQFAADAKAVEADLKTLKTLLERKS